MIFFRYIDEVLHGQNFDFQVAKSADQHIFLGLTMMMLSDYQR